MHPSLSSAIVQFFPGVLEQILAKPSAPPGAEPGCLLLAEPMTHQGTNILWAKAIQTSWKEWKNITLANEEKIGVLCSSKLCYFF